MTIRPPIKRGDALPHWKGGRHLDKHSGYVRLRLQPDNWLYPHSSHGYMLEHRYVMANKLGRPLRSNKTVHHVNGVKYDNQEENLELHRKKHGNSVKLVCACCGSTDIREIALE